MRPSNLSKFAFLFLLTCTAYSQTNPAEDQPKTVVKTNTRLVVVDVVATDGKGEPITDLAEQNFTVLENGRPQKISAFNFQHPQAVTSTEPQPAANVFTNVPATRSNSSNIILLDSLNGEFASRAQALDELNKFLGSQQEIQPTALYVLQEKLTLLHDFTTHPKELKEALAGFHPQVATQMDTVYAAASSFTQHGSFQTSPQIIESTLRALNALAQSLAAYPGRKNLIWLSEAFPVNLFPDIAKNSATGLPDNDTISSLKGSYADYLEDVKKVADAFMTSQVAIYPIDAAGVGRISQVEALTTMRSMAERTGGKTYANQNDLKNSIRGSLDDGSTYYTFAYYPDDKNWDGKFRRVEVKTDRQNVNLRYREGYYALNPDVESRDKEDPKKLGVEFTDALALSSPSSTAILFHATAAPPASGQKLTVNFAIDPHTLSYIEQPDGAQQASLGCAIVAYTGKGSMVKHELNNVVGKVKSTDFPKLMQSNFPCQCTIDLKPGEYTLRLGVLDKNSTLIGTTTAAVTVR